MSINEPKIRSVPSNVEPPSINDAAIKEYFNNPKSNRLVLRKEVKNDKETQQIQCISKKEIGLWEGFLAKIFGWGDASLKNVVNFAQTNIVPKNPKNPLLEKAVSLLEQKNKNKITLSFKDSEAKELIEFIQDYIKTESDGVIQKVFSQENVSEALKEELFNSAIKTQNEEVIYFLQQHQIKDTAGHSILFRLCQLPQNELTDTLKQIVNNLLKDVATYHIPDEIAAFEQAATSGHFDVVKTFLSSAAFRKSLSQVDASKNNVFHRLAQGKKLTDNHLTIFLEAAKQVPALFQNKNKQNQTPIVLLKLTHSDFLKKLANAVLEEDDISPQQKACFFIGKVLSNRFRNINAENFKNQISSLMDGFTKLFPTEQLYFNELVFGALLLEKYSSQNSAIDPKELKEDLRLFSYIGVFSKEFVMGKLVTQLQNNKGLPLPLSSIFGNYKKISETYTNNKRTIKPGNAFKMAWTWYDAQQKMNEVTAINQQQVQTLDSSLSKAFWDQRNVIHLETENPLGEGSFKRVQEAIRIVPKQNELEIVALQRSTTDQLMDLTPQQKQKQKQVLEKLKETLHADPCPSLMQIHDVYDFANGDRVISCKLYGKSLADSIDEKIKEVQQNTIFSSLQEAVILYDYFTGVAWLHKHGFSHRDLKSNNVLLRRNEKGLSRGVVIDLDGACMQDDLNHPENYKSYWAPTKTYSLTAGYTSPETLKHAQQHPQTPFGPSFEKPQDVWCMGVDSYLTIFRDHLSYVLTLDKASKRGGAMDSKLFDDIGTKREEILQKSKKLQAAAKQEISKAVQLIETIQGKLLELTYNLLNPDPRQRPSAQKAAETVRDIIVAALQAVPESQNLPPFQDFLANLERPQLVG